MPSKAVSRQAVKRFQVGLNRLEDLWDEVRKAEESLTQRQLNFAKSLYELEQTAKERASAGALIWNVAGDLTGQS